LATSLSWFINKAFAYLDPGSGSFILQLLIAALLGGLFVIKTQWNKIVQFFRSRSSKEQGDQEE
jgi:hypothetical protein